MKIMRIQNLLAAALIGTLLAIALPGAVAPAITCMYSRL